MIDNQEMDEILSILEELEDEQEAARLLAEFNKKSAALGKLILNLDPGLDHEKWKSLCDQERAGLEDVVRRIRSLG